MAEFSSQNNYIEWKDWEEGDFASCSQAASATYERELTPGLGRTSRTLSVLEIGFGNGEFAGYCKNRGWQYRGSEAIEELVCRAKGAGWDAHLAPPAVPQVEEQYDLIVAWDVFEHLSLEELRNTLAACSAALGDDGVLVARLPSGDSPISGHIYYGDTTHQTLLGTRAITQLAQEADLQVVQIEGSRPPVFGGRPAGLPARLAVHLIRVVGTALLKLASSKREQLVFDPNMVITMTTSDRTRERCK